MVIDGAVEHFHRCGGSQEEFSEQVRSKEGDCYGFSTLRRALPALSESVFSPLVKISEEIQT